MNIIHGFSTGFSWQQFHGVQTHENSLIYGFFMHGYIILLQDFMVISLPMKRLPTANFMGIS